jgi:hypothetical protein
MVRLTQSFSLGLVMGTRSGMGNLCAEMDESVSDAFHQRGTNHLPAVSPTSSVPTSVPVPVNRTYELGLVCVAQARLIGGDCQGDSKRECTA